MEIAKCFVFFIAVISIPWCETSEYWPRRIRKEFKAVRNAMSLIREDISALFDKTYQLSMSAVEDCGLYVSDNKSSCPPMMDHDEWRDMVKVNGNNLLLKYQSLINAFVTEKKTIRELQDQLRAVEDILLASKKVAKERDQEEQNRLRSMEEIISDIRNNMTLTSQVREQMDPELQRRLQSVENNISENNKVANETDRQVQDQLRSMEDAIAASNKVADETDRQVQDQLRSMENTISESNKVANERDGQVQDQLRSMEDAISESNEVADERDRQVQDQLRSMENAISESNMVANQRDRQVQDQLRSMKESIEALHHIMNSFMTTTSYRTEEDLLKTETTSVTPEITTVPIINTICKAVPESGAYTLYLELIMSNVNVYCDQDTDGGGWIVFTRRQNGSVNFDRSWVDYKHGFGSPDGEFWAGNDLLHKFTKAKPFQLRIDMEDFDGNTAFAMYDEFQVGAEGDKYRLHVSGYSGTAGDSLIDTKDGWSKHAGMQFTTFDSDNDKWDGVNCARWLRGGWWYNACGKALLTATYSHDKWRVGFRGVLWYVWKGWNRLLKRVEMKIR